MSAMGDRFLIASLIQQKNIFRIALLSKFQKHLILFDVSSVSIGMRYVGELKVTASNSQIQATIAHMENERSRNDEGRKDNSQRIYRLLVVR